MRRKKGIELSSASEHERQLLKLLELELRGLRRDLRCTMRAYAARLEIELAECVAVIGSYGKAERLPREHLQEIRDLTIAVRKRKLKPEKGRRKDLRKIDSLIENVHAVTNSNPLR